MLFSASCNSGGDRFNPVESNLTPLCTYGIWRTIIAKEIQPAVLVLVLVLEGLPTPRWGARSNMAATRGQIMLVMMCRWFDVPPMGQNATVQRGLHCNRINSHSLATSREEWWVVKTTSKRYLIDENSSSRYGIDIVLTAAVSHGPLRVSLRS